MRTAPIQIGEITFRKVSVELDVAHAPKDGGAPADVAFDLENVRITTHTGFSPVDSGQAPGHSFFVMLRVVIDNKPVGDDDVVKYSPYLVEVEAGAVVRVLPGAEVVAAPQDLAVINGTSLLWSAIREQVCGLTARMPVGGIVLPTVNFRDLKQSLRPGSNAAADAKAVRGTRRKQAKPRNTPT